MKKLVAILAIVACLGIGSAHADLMLDSENPCCDFTFSGGFSELFGPGGEGSADGWINANGDGWCEQQNTFQWDLIRAVSEGAQGAYPIYTTVYSGGAFILYSGLTTITEFDNATMTVVADKTDDTFTFEAYAINGQYKVKLNGMGQVTEPHYSGNGIIGTLEGYGQICQVPAPGAILLGSMGAGLVGWLRRRNSF